MHINEAVIDYGTPLTVKVTDSSMRLEQATAGNQITLTSDELVEIVSLARLMGWEGFND